MQSQAAKAAQQELAKVCSASCSNAAVSSRQAKLCGMGLSTSMLTNPGGTMPHIKLSKTCTVNVAQATLQSLLLLLLCAGPYEHLCGPPPVHHPWLRPHRGAVQWAGGGGGHACRADGEAGHLCRHVSAFGGHLGGVGAKGGVGDCRHANALRRGVGVCTHECGRAGSHCSGMHQA